MTLSLAVEPATCSEDAVISQAALVLRQERNLPSSASDNRSDALRWGMDALRWDTWNDALRRDIWVQLGEGAGEQRGAGGGPHRGQQVHDQECGQGHLPPPRPGVRPTLCFPVIPLSRIMWSVRFSWIRDYKHPPSPIAMHLRCCVTYYLSMRRGHCAVLRSCVIGSCYRISI